MPEQERTGQRSGAVFCMEASRGHEGEGLATLSVGWLHFRLLFIDFRQSGQKAIGNLPLSRSRNPSHLLPAHGMHGPDGSHPTAGVTSKKHYRVA